MVQDTLSEARSWSPLSIMDNELNIWQQGGKQEPQVGIRVDVNCRSVEGHVPLVRMITSWGLGQVCGMEGQSCV